MSEIIIIKPISYNLFSLSLQKILIFLSWSVYISFTDSLEATILESVSTSVGQRFMMF